AQHERGKIFGMLALTMSLAGVSGGAMGPIADQWGYPTLFALVACIWLVQIALSPFLYERRVASESAENSESNGQRGRLGIAFLLLVGANACYAIGSFVGILGRSMAMDVEGFTATAISGGAAIGSI